MAKKEPPAGLTATGIAARFDQRPNIGAINSAYLQALQNFRNTHGRPPVWESIQVHIRFTERAINCIIVEAPNAEPREYAVMGQSAA